MKALLAAIVVWAALALPAAAHPFQLCKPREEMVKFLQQQYGETLTAYGLTTKGEVIVEFTIAENGDFSVFLTFPNGKSCMMVSGTNFSNEPLPVPEIVDPTEPDDPGT